MLPTLNRRFRFIEESDVPRLLHLVAQTIEQNAGATDVFERPLVLDLNAEFRTYDPLYSFFNELFYERHHIKGLDDYLTTSRAQFILFMLDLGELLWMYRMHHWIESGQVREVRHLPRGGFTCARLR